MGFVSRNTKTEEIIKLAIMMQNSYRGVNIKDIADYFECSIRTAERMKALMLDLFSTRIEEVPSADRSKRWRFKKGTANFLVTFDINDILLLENLKSDLSTDKIEELAQLKELIAKIKVISSDRKIVFNEQNIASVMEQEGFLVRSKDKKNINTIYLELIRNAILQSKKMVFLYGLNNNSSKKIKVIPYGIKIADKYYLVAYSDEIGGIRQFSFNKIFKLNMIDENFTRPNEFDLDNCKILNIDYLTNTKKIVLEFSQVQKECALDAQFNIKQKVKILDDDRVQVTFNTEISDELCLELVKWSYHIKIIEPLELKIYYRNFLNKILKNI